PTCLEETIGLRRNAVPAHGVQVKLVPGAKFSFLLGGSDSHAEPGGPVDPPRDRGVIARIAGENLFRFDGHYQHVSENPRSRPRVRADERLPSWVALRVNRHHT